MNTAQPLPQVNVALPQGRKLLQKLVRHLHALPCAAAVAPAGSVLQNTCLPMHMQHVLQGCRQASTLQQQAAHHSLS